MTNKLKEIYLNWRRIRSTNAFIYVILSMRGLGKTFGIKKSSIHDFIKSNGQNRFIYVCNTLTECETLAQNKGEKFFAGLIDYYRKNPSKRNNRYLDILTGSNSFITENENKETIMTTNTIKIGGVVAGYLLSLNDFSNIKRNDYPNVKSIIVDEFVSEKFDIRTLDNPKKLVSVIQSISRTREVKIYLLGNTVRRADPLLKALKLDKMKKGQHVKIFDRYGLLIDAYNIDPNQYADYAQLLDESVAGRFASYLGQDNLEKNEFNDDMPIQLEIPAVRKNSHLLCCIHGINNISIRINITNSGTELYVLEDYGENTRNRYCFDKKYIEGFVKYNLSYKDYLLSCFSSDKCFFENPNVYNEFKLLMGLAIS